MMALRAKRTETGGNFMISSRLEEGTSIKTCIQCGYETASIDKMLKHLNDHRLEELIELKKSAPNERYKGMTT